MPNLVEKHRVARFVIVTDDSERWAHDVDDVNQGGRQKICAALVTKRLVLERAIPTADGNDRLVVLVPYATIEWQCDAQVLSLFENESDPAAAKQPLRGAEPWRGQDASAKAAEADAAAFVADVNANSAKIAASSSYGKLPAKKPDPAPPTNGKKRTFGDHLAAGKPLGGGCDELIFLVAHRPSDTLQGWARALYGSNAGVMSTGRVRSLINTLLKRGLVERKAGMTAPYASLTSRGLSIAQTLS